MWRVTKPKGRVWFVFVSLVKPKGFNLNPEVLTRKVKKMRARMEKDMALGLTIAFARPKTVPTRKRTFAALASKLFNLIEVSSSG